MPSLVSAHKHLLSRLNSTRLNGWSWRVPEHLLFLTYKRWKPWKRLLDFRKAFSTGVNLEPQAGFEDCVNIKGKMLWSTSLFLSLRSHEPDSNFINYLLIPEANLMLAIDSDSCSHERFIWKSWSQLSIQPLFIGYCQQSNRSCICFLNTIVYKPAK